MCGIAGVVDLKRQDLDTRTARIETACQALRHRGPDGSGRWVEPLGDRGVIGLGATRLAVQDPLPHADQPLRDASGRYVLVYNGELYNVDELRGELKDQGWDFRTHGDTEVVLASCATWGVEAPSRFNGMWGFAFYDRRNKKGFICRDRFGIKPLFWALHRDALCFASELGALQCLDDWDRGLDDEAALQHLQFGYIAHPRTIYRGAARLAPGHTVAFDARAIHPPQAFYGLREAVERKKRQGRDTLASYPRSVEHLRRAIGQAVVARRVADVPLGALLSGGLDSSIVATHLAQACGRPIATFSIGHAEHGVYDETHYARLVAQRLGADHHEWKLTREDVLQALPAILDHLAEPVGDSSILPTALVSRLARRHVTVALSGDGADEVFGGYWRYAAQGVHDAYLHLPAWLRRYFIEPFVRRASVSKSSSGADRLRQFRKLLRAPSRHVLERHLAWATILAPEAESILRDASAARELNRKMLSIARRLADGLTTDTEKDLNGVLAFDLQYGLPADMLQKVDLAGMACSLEVRVPFLDPAVVESAMALPASHKINRTTRKRLLIDAYRDLLPEPILERPKKGFEVPFGEYMRGPLLSLFHDVVDQPTVESIGFLSHQGIQRVLDDHLRRRGEHADLLFALLTLCWHVKRR